MKLSLIAAMSRNRVIGVDNRLPWNLPEDLRNFKRITMGKPILMGRKTFESIGRPLPGRKNIVITRNRNYRTSPECFIFHSIDAALEQTRHHKELIVIGGASFYEQLLPLADRLYLTVVDTTVSGDTFFPSFDTSLWTEIECRYVSAKKSRLPFRIVTLERQQKGAADR